MPCVAEVVNRSLKADCTDYNYIFERSRNIKTELYDPTFPELFGSYLLLKVGSFCWDTLSTVLDL